MRWPRLERWERRAPALPMPRLLRRRWLWFLVMALATLPFFVTVPIALRRHPAIAPLGDQFHVVLMAAFTILLYWRGPLRGRLGYATLAAIAAGAAIEFLQPLFGRSALVKDFLLDLVGIGIVAGFVLWKGHRRRAGLALMTVLLLSVPAQLYYLPGVIAASYESRRSFPLLADFESGREHWIWTSNFNTRLQFTRVPDGPDGPTGVLRVTAAPPDNWPGVKVRRFSHDWSDYRALEFDVRVVIAPGDSVPMSLRLDDFPGTRENRGARFGFFADRRWRTVRFELPGAMLADGSRPLDTSDLDLILVYLPRPKAPVVFELDNFRLRR